MSTEIIYPKIIQGGMGIYIANPQGARSVSMNGQQGTVSGVTAERIVTRLLQNGDPNGDIRRALSHFPFPLYAEKVIQKYYVEGGIPKDAPYKGVPFFSVDPPASLISLNICSVYALVWLAKEGHSNPISINFLEKVSMPLIYGILGAMLADVDFITMGAGIPLKIPEVINAILENRVVTYPVSVIGYQRANWTHLMCFNPEEFFGEKMPQMKKPGFIPIISSVFFASLFITELPEGSVYGFIVEESTAGGHNAPPKGKPILNEQGIPLPIYGPRDKVDYAKMVEFGLPFWIGGSYASPEKLKWALSVGAQGIQVGSIFALAEEFGMDAAISRTIRKNGFNNQQKVRTDMRISPTGYPFKVAVVDGTISQDEVYLNRERVCSQGGLIVPYEKEDGSIGYRCPAEPVKKYTDKGGDIKDTIGRGCLCNGLLGAAALGDYIEPSVATIGDDVTFLPDLMVNENSSYTTKDAIDYLLSYAA